MRSLKLTLFMNTSILNLHLLFFSLSLLSTHTLYTLTNIIILPNTFNRSPSLHLSINHELISSATPSIILYISFLFPNSPSSSMQYTLVQTHLNRLTPYYLNLHSHCIHSMSSHSGSYFLPYF